MQCFLINTVYTDSKDMDIPVKKLKQILDLRGVDYSDCLEKCPGAYFSSSRGSQ